MAKVLLSKSNDRQEDIAFEKAKRLAESALKKYGIQYAEPDGAIYLLINHNAPCDFQLCEDLKKEGIIVLPGAIYGESCQGTIRACFALSDHEVVAAFEKLGNYLSGMAVGS